jgi:cell division septum initiation protein DivIVA
MKLPLQCSQHCASTVEQLQQGARAARASGEKVFTHTMHPLQQQFRRSQRSIRLLNVAGSRPRSNY